MHRQYATLLGICSTAFVLAIAPAKAQDAALVAAAKKEGQVTWYTTLLVDNGARPLAQAFEKKYGIKVGFSRADDAGTVLKIMTEVRARNLQADVFDGFSGIAPLRKADLVAKYMPDTEKGFPADLKDPQGYWTGFYTNIYVPGINTKIVPRDQFPKTFPDLLDPRYSGKLVWNPTNSTAAPLFVGTILNSMGQDKGMEFLRALAKQKISKLELSARAILDQVIAGDFAAGLMMSAAHSEISSAKGAPVDWARIDPTPAAVIVTGLLKGGPNPNAGKLFLHFATSEEGQAVLRDGGYIPALPAVAPSVKALSLTAGGYRPTYLNGMTIDGPLDNWMQIVRQTF